MSTDDHNPDPQPGNIYRDKSLQIIDDALFERIQLKRRRNRGGRRGKKKESTIPKILNGRAFCPRHDIPLQCDGMSGGVMRCTECKKLREQERELYTYLSRRQGTEVLLKVIAMALLEAECLIPNVIAACQQAAQAAQAVDPTRRLKVEQLLRELDISIKATYRYPGKTPEEILEVERNRDDFRKEQSELRHEHAELKLRESAPKRVPAIGELRSKLKELHAIFSKKAFSKDQAQIARINRLIDLLTGGKILLKQCGERRKHGGWLEGSCPWLLKQYLINEQGFGNAAEDSPSELHFNFRRPRQSEKLKQQILELYQAGRTVDEIMQQLKKGKSTVNRYVDAIHLEAGKPKPTRKERRKLISAREDKLPFYKQIAEAVLEMLQQGVFRDKIAERLNTNTNTLEKTVEFLREQGHVIPDGRSTNSGRKPHQPPQPPEEQGDDEEGPKAG